MNHIFNYNEHIYKSLCFYLILLVPHPEISAVSTALANIPKQAEGTNCIFQHLRSVHLYFTSLT